MSAKKKITKKMVDKVDAVIPESKEKKIKRVKKISTDKTENAKTKSATKEKPRRKYERKQVRSPKRVVMVNALIMTRKCTDEQIADMVSKEFPELPPYTTVNVNSQRVNLNNYIKGLTDMHPYKRVKGPKSNTEIDPQHKKVAKVTKTKTKDTK